MTTLANIAVIAGIDVLGHVSNISVFRNLRGTHANAETITETNIRSAHSADKGSMALPSDLATTTCMRREILTFQI